MKIEKKQLKEIEFLFNQSAKGLHLLFDDTARLASILKEPTEEQRFFNSENMKRIQVLFTDLISKKTFQDKQEYLRQLNSENFEILVRTYFHIVDNTLLTATRNLH